MWRSVSLTQGGDSSSLGHFYDLWFFNSQNSSTNITGWRILKIIKSPSCQVWKTPRLHWFLQRSSHVSLLQPKQHLRVLWHLKNQEESIFFSNPRPVETSFFHHGEAGPNPVNLPECPGNICQQIWGSHVSEELVRRLYVGSPFHTVHLPSFVFFSLKWDLNVFLHMCFCYVCLHFVMYAAQTLYVRYKCNI